MYSIFDNTLQRDDFLRYSLYDKCCLDPQPCHKMRYLHSLIFYCIGVQNLQVLGVCHNISKMYKLEFWLCINCVHKDQTCTRRHSCSILHPDDSFEKCLFGKYLVGLLLCHNEMLLYNQHPDCMGDQKEPVFDCMTRKYKVQ